uniref:phosphoglycerate mutase (2,3-diphosphoglycerate-dependent) n=2 Tax=Petromyzon marinus TaxID=7757 RepID=A0AAJ7WY09_PETMA|nr:bisphosphoglycerate mutase-like isoform X2 [Petromyzon marinus]
MVDGGGASSSSVRFRGDGSGARSDGVNAPAAATAACDAMATRTLVLVRHGEGSWTRENRFCSWVDQPLSADGEAEARRCSRLLAAAGIRFDAAFSSLLTRAIKTAWLILEGVGQAWVPLAHSWRLNERHYGALVGLNRAQLALNHGEEQVKAWRRAYDVRPPPIDEAHPYFDEIHGDRRYASCDVPRGKIPRGESLRDVLERLLPYWEGSIVPELRAGKNVLVSAHGNSVRAIIKHLEGISDADILHLTIPTGVPVVLQLDDELAPVGERRYLGDTAEIAAAIKRIEDQGKAPKGASASPDPRGAVVATTATTAAACPSP